MSIAEETREAVREHPFLYEALRAGIINYTAAADFLDVNDTDAVTVALRRYADELAVTDTTAGDKSVRVRMKRGIGEADDGHGLLVVGDTGFAPDTGELTAILATGDLTVTTAQRVLGRCAIADVTVSAAGFTAEMLILVVGRHDGPDTLRLVESVVGSSTESATDI
ncbi:hypothetical protein ACFQJ7_00855 [Halovenus rubra]|uniref:Uncharacterized protein n=2 Tax=Halovenus rubra TaxID=869890 RepID=A0ACC7DZY3_9EURY|nr:hypothetical protein [Halovenus rubra]